MKDFALFIIHDWNSLPENGVSVKTVDNFKIQLDYHLEVVMYQFRQIIQLFYYNFLLFLNMSGSALGRNYIPALVKNLNFFKYLKLFEL